MRRALMLLVLGVVLACEKGGPVPQEPVWGKQACAHCSMLVSEKAPSAQVVLKNGQRKFFDDVGCLVAWEEREHPDVSARWVRGPSAEGWVDPAQTRFAEGQTTPMDFGFIAAREGVTFDVVRAAVAKKARPGTEVTP
ncbi:MAG: hypothetical protein JNM17_39000 [Archangium sp.]|nr:hypothetical protein [Archangium sp.]